RGDGAAREDRGGRGRDQEAGDSELPRPGGGAGLSEAYRGRSGWCGRGGRGGGRRAQGSGGTAGQGAVHGGAGLLHAPPAAARGRVARVRQARGGGGGLPRGPQAEPGKRLVVVRALAVPTRRGPAGGGGRGEAVPRGVEVRGRDTVGVGVLSCKQY